MDICLKNFSEESRNVIYKAKSLAKECKYKTIEPQVLFIALYSLEQELCMELLNYMQVPVNPFMIEIGQSTNQIEHITDDYSDESVKDLFEYPYFSIETTAVLLKSSYLSYVNGNWSTKPEYIFQALFEESSVLKSILPNISNNSQTVTCIMNLYRQAHPKEHFTLEYLEWRPDPMGGWGYDVTNDENLSDFEKGYVIHALEEYCRSDYTREFSLEEKRVIAKLDTTRHHIGPMVRMFQEEINNIR